ncbi:hypothetical protein AcV5_000538 [Taiwanofungus camphoratus]|nr:hypothetical protein AcV5_000538 [Antrodia cinnamomea]
MKLSTDLNRVRARRPEHPAPACPPDQSPHRTSIGLRDGHRCQFSVLRREVRAAEQGCEFGIQTFQTSRVRAHAKNLAILGDRRSACDGWLLAPCARARRGSVQPGFRLEND